MLKIVRNILAALAGILAGGVTVLIVESISSWAHPKPEHISLSDADAMREWIASLPMTAFAAVLAAWSCGAFVGVWVGRMLATHRGIWPGIVAGFVLFLATIGNLVAIPHPVWFAIVGLAVYPVFGLLGLALSTPKSLMVEAVREIQAEKQLVFRALADIKNFSQAVPGIANIEFVGDLQYGVGTRFRETRIMNGKEATTELEVTELVDGELVRIVSYAGGTLWDTIFTVAQATSTQPTHMTMTMTCVPQNFFSKILVPTILPIVSKAVQSDMDSVKAYCETFQG